MCYRSRTGRWPVWARDYLCNKRAFRCFFCSKKRFVVGKQSWSHGPESPSLKRFRTAHYGLFLHTHETETVRLLTCHCTSVDTTQLVSYTRPLLPCVYCETWAETSRRHWHWHCHRRMLHVYWSSFKVHFLSLFSSQARLAERRTKLEQPLLQQGTLTTLPSHARRASSSGTTNEKRKHKLLVVCSLYQFEQLDQTAKVVFAFGTFTVL